MSLSYNPRDNYLGAFKDYLNERGVVQGNHVPYYLNWIQTCYAMFSKPADRILSREEQDHFLNDLALTPAGWQVEQANDALRLYEYYLSSKDPVIRDRGLSRGDDAWVDLEARARVALRVRHRALSTEKAYINWLRSFGGFMREREPKDLTALDMQNYLSYLAVERRVAPATQNQALNALVFVYRHVLGQSLGDKELNAVRAVRRRRLPVVLSVDEVHEVFDALPERHALMARLIYGCGLRVRECVSLRIKDLDFDRKMVVVRSGKGDKDRRTVLPVSLSSALRDRVSKSRAVYEHDRKNDLDGIFMPGALDRKYPNAGKEWAWFWLFPARGLSVDPRSLLARRHHQHPAAFQRAFKAAVQKAGIVKAASVHTLRHSFATHLLEGGQDIRTIRELLGHERLETTMIYTHVATKNILGVKSPLDG